MKTQSKASAMLVAAVMSVGGLAMVGCDNTESPTVTTETKTTEVRTSGETLGDKAKEAAADVKDAAKDAGNAVAEAGRDVGHNVAEAARDVRDGTDTTATPANTAADAGVVAQATELYNKAIAAINEKKLDDAQGYVDKLKELKAKLPADWQTKVDQLVTQFDSAKATLNALPNVQIPR